MHHQENSENKRTRSRVEYKNQAYIFHKRNHLCPNNVLTKMVYNRFLSTSIVPVS